MNFSGFKGLYRRLSGGTETDPLHPYGQQLSAIKSFARTFAGQTETRLQDAANGLKRSVRSGASPDSLLPEAFGLVFEIVRRVLNLTPLDGQLIAGIAMYQGKLVQMQTGEGKTLAAVFPAWLHGLCGRGMHMLTSNDYLARRDAAWMEAIYRSAGLSVGVVQEGMDIEERRKAYAADITYFTAKEAGFDYLRDCLVLNHRDAVHRGFNIAIVDEADSILIDEARIPLVIATTSPGLPEDTRTIALLAKGMQKDTDFLFDDYRRNINLTETGVKHVERRLGCGNLYREDNLDLLTLVNLALHAEYMLQKDKDYIVRNGKVELVDEFTGRVADRRRWPDGIQAAIEAKENLAIQPGGRVLNSITIQHFLQKYSRLAGMTATACPGEDEFRRFYGLDVVAVASHKPCIRRDHQDRLFKTRSLKNQAVVKAIETIHSRQQPVLVGTGSVAESESLAKALRDRGIACAVLNARQDEDEAGVIANAGRLGAVTISTNMAGRGVDIQLGCGDDTEKKSVAALGGLYIMGTNKHESVRIDNQLRGRSGRRGDPGQSCFFISLEDDLFIRYDLTGPLPAELPVDASDGSISSAKVMDRIQQLQRIVEGQNLEVKKTLCLYSDLVEQQRMLLLEKRTQWLLTDTCLWFFKNHDPQRFHTLLQAVDEETLSAACRQILLLSVDWAWSRYLAEISDLRESIHLVRFAGTEPIVEFRKQAIAMFEGLEAKVEINALNVFHQIKPENGKINLSRAGLRSPSSTWTYLVNDNPFDPGMMPGIVGDIGKTVAAGITRPLLKMIARIIK